MRCLISWVFFSSSANSKLFFCRRAHFNLIVNETNYNTYPDADTISDANGNADTCPACSYQCNH
jgi:hypothetical protein